MDGEQDRSEGRGRDRYGDRDGDRGRGRGRGSGIESLTRSVRDASPVGEPDSGAHSAQLHQQEPGHQHQEPELASHGIHIYHQHLEGHLACARCDQQSEVDVEHFLQGPCN